MTVYRTAFLSVLALAALATAGCKQPGRSTGTPAASASLASSSGATPMPAPAAGATATGDKGDFRAARHQVREACKDDLQACRTAGGDTRRMRCLRARMDQLKPACKEALQTAMVERREGRGGRGAR